MPWSGTIERRPVDTDRAPNPTSSGDILASPEDVAAWILARVGELSKTADDAARAKNALRTQTVGVFQGVARRGRSVFTSVHATATEVWDIRADYAPTMNDGCVSAKGHSYVKNDKGEWRCTKCGALM